MFPVVEEAGYVTVTQDEVVSPGTSVAATIDALLARAQVALIDGSSYSTGLELQIALDVLPRERVIVVMDRIRPLSPAVRPPPLTLNTVEILTRDEETIANPEPLVSAIRARLAALGRETSHPQQLLDQGHFNAAVVVAFGMLEEALIPRLEFARPERPPGAMRLVQAAADQGILTPQERERFGEWVSLRNLVVHGSLEPDPDTARRAVADIEAALARLRDV